MPAWSEYFIGIEDTSILLTQQHLWVIPKAFLKMWLNTVKIGFVWKDVPMNFFAVSMS